MAASTSLPSLPHEEMSKNAPIGNGEDVRTCPLCCSTVKSVFIHYNQKTLVCVNTECTYPFGTDDFTLFKEDNEKKTHEVLHGSQIALHSSSDTLSIVSSSVLSEMDKIRNSCDINDDFYAPPPPRRVYFNRSQKKKPKENETNKKIQKQLESIKKLNVELIAPTEKTSVPSIKNEKWIKNLLGLQKSSGISLLKPEELKLLNKNKPEVRELKFDIGVGTGNMSSIEIKFSNLAT